MTQQESSDDYVLATGKLNSVRDLVEIAFEKINMPLYWEGEGLREIGYSEDGTPRVHVSPEFYRPAEVDLLLGSAKKAEKILGWTPKTTFKELVNEMIEFSLNKN